MEEKRYCAGIIEEDGTEDFYWDTRFNSIDDAIEWAVNHDCSHIYDAEKEEFIPITEN